MQIGGPKGIKLTISQGDVIFFPAGVAHKRIESSKDFKSIGCYPFAIDYDIKRGLTKNDSVIENIKLPKTDPIYGDKGPLLGYWKTKKMTRLRYMYKITRYSSVIIS